MLSIIGWNTTNKVRADIAAIEKMMKVEYLTSIESDSLDAGDELFFPQSDDVCYGKNGELGKFENDPSQRLSIPFVGYSYYKKTRFNYYIEKILRNEGITHKDFFSKEIQEISSEGGFRNSSIKCDGYNVNDNIVLFSLSRGSFATIVLREIMKPENPLISGF